MADARRLRLEAQLAAAELRLESLEFERVQAAHAGRDVSGLDVKILDARATVAEISEALGSAAPAEAVPAPPAATLPAPEYLDTPEAAALLGVSVKTLESLRARGEGPPWKKVGRRVRYEHSSLVEWFRR